jgi:hypothetical protein
MCDTIKTVNSASSESSIIIGRKVVVYKIEVYQHMMVYNIFNGEYSSAKMPKPQLSMDISLDKVNRRSVEKALKERVNSDCILTEMDIPDIVKLETIVAMYNFILLLDPIATVIITEKKT